MKPAKVYLILLFIVFATHAKSQNDTRDVIDIDVKELTCLDESRSSKFIYSFINITNNSDKQVEVKLDIKFIEGGSVIEREIGNMTPTIKVNANETIEYGCSDLKEGVEKSLIKLKGENKYNLLYDKVIVEPIKL